jgi:hypothetical protein
MKEDIKIPFDGNDLRVLVDSYEATIKKLEAQLSELIQASNEREDHYIKLILDSESTVAAFRNQGNSMEAFKEHLSLRTRIKELEIENERYRLGMQENCKLREVIELLGQTEIGWIKQFRMDSEVINTLENRASVLEEKLIDAFMAGADWLERYRTGKQIVCYHERQKAMGFAIGEQIKIIKETR